MDKNEAIIRYALQHRELDDLKVWLLNGGSIKDYFASHKQNIKLNLNQSTFSVTAKDAEKIVEKMMPVAFSKQDLMHLYFRLSEEKQMEWYPKVFPYYPDAIKVKEKPSSEEILEAVKRNHYLTIPRSFYDILSDVDLAECLFVNDYNVFLFSEAEVNEEYRNQGIFSTMRRILMDWFYLEGECYCLYADNKELIERNTAIAINKGFVVLDKENTLYDIYANKKCPYAYRANPIH